MSAAHAALEALLAGDELRAPSPGLFRLLVQAGADRPAVVLTSTRDESDFGSQLRESGARGFVPKDELSAERIASLCR